MKSNKPHTQFWKVLATVNVLALVYPINLVHRAETADENLFAAFALIGVVFLLLTVDAVSMVAREVISDPKR
jgi:hypothetical protein